VFTIATFYRFAAIDEPAAFAAVIRDACTVHGVTGTVIVAGEGVNGTIAGGRTAVQTVVDVIASQPGFHGLEPQWSSSRNDPFVRLRVRVKREIVALGIGTIDVAGLTGTHVTPSEWDELLGRDDVVVIDARNDYETEIGSFPGSLDPHTRSFTDFPAWVESEPRLAGRPPVAMYCTGGVRCEKASAWLRSRGFDEVYQLDGGILTYLEAVPEQRSQWSGECYVFDRRVSVGHRVTPGDSEVCPNCNRVVTVAERRQPGYRTGVTCPRCHDTISPDRRMRFAERQRQITLATQRGTNHLGPDQ